MGKVDFVWFLKWFFDILLTTKPFSRLFQIAGVEHSKDDIKILQHTVLNHIGEGLLPIKKGGRFIIQNRNNTLSIVFSDAQSDASSRFLCNVPIRLFIVGDLKFYASMLGRDNLSGSWCMWCQLSPIEWKIPTTKRSRSGWVDNSKPDARCCGLPCLGFCWSIKLYIPCVTRGNWPD